MKKIITIKLLSCWIKSNEAVTAIEYALIASGVAIAFSTGAFAFSNFFMTLLNNMIVYIELYT